MLLRSVQREWVLLRAWLASRVRPLGPYPGWYFGVAEDGAQGAGVRGRRRLWEYCNRERLERPITVRWYDGLRVRLYLGNDMSRCLYVGGCYEPNEFAFLAEVLAPGMTFADVGANEGLYTLFASRRVGETGTVLAFEPSSREFARLGVNLGLNRARNVQAFRIGLAAAHGVGALRAAGYEHEGQNTLGQFIYAGVECAGVETVTLAGLDGFLARHNLPAPDIMKIDVEGAELAVLQGARALLTTRHPLMVLELSDRALRQQGSSAAQLLQFLRTVGYTVFTFDEATGRPTCAGRDESLSHNIVAAHPRRPWKGLRHG